MATFRNVAKLISNRGIEAVNESAADILFRFIYADTSNKTLLVLPADGADMVAGSILYLVTGMKKLFVTSAPSRSADGSYYTVAVSPISLWGKLFRGGKTVAENLPIFRQGESSFTSSPLAEIQTGDILRILKKEYLILKTSFNSGLLTLTTEKIPRP